jgi:hypothetical protein
VSGGGFDSDNSRLIDVPLGTRLIFEGGQYRLRLPSVTYCGAGQEAVGALLGLYAFFDWAIKNGRATSEGDQYKDAAERFSMLELD